LAEFAFRSIMGIYMAFRKILTTLFVAAILPFPAVANNSNEIVHLLNFVENTDCLYIRNGNQHKGPEARLHIQKKYDYYYDDIDSAEDFIEYSATKSVLSGSRYKVDCPGQDLQFSGDWLLSELKSFRMK
ncbi:MAG: DUF5329 family protein, partial [Psychromonas sp.]